MVLDWLSSSHPFSVDQSLSSHSVVASLFTFLIVVIYSVTVITNGKCNLPFWVLMWDISLKTQFENSRNKGLFWQSQWIRYQTNQATWHHITSHRFKCLCIFWCCCSCWCIQWWLSEQIRCCLCKCTCSIEVKPFGSHQFGNCVDNQSFYTSLTSFNILKLCVTTDNLSITCFWHLWCILLKEK